MKSTSIAVFGAVIALSACGGSKTPDAAPAATVTPTTTPTTTTMVPPTTTALPIDPFTYNQHFWIRSLSSMEATGDLQTLCDIAKTNLIDVLDKLAEMEAPALTETETVAVLFEVCPTTIVAAPTTTVAPITLTVVSVVDGDTLDMSDGTTIRLIGIDTPERGECGYDEATAVLTSLVTGFDITLVPGARDDVDKYGRLLRYVETIGSPFWPVIDVNLSMIESGRAIARYDGRDGYGEHPRQAAYVAADDDFASLNDCPAPAPAPAPAYKNCDAVRAAGAAPIHVGDPGWSTKFDKDGDGVGCE